MALPLHEEIPLFSIIEERIIKNSFPLYPVPTGLTPKLKKIQNIRCVIFDIYGTLVISESGDINPTVGQSNHFEKALFNCGLHNLPEELGKQVRDLYFSLINKTHAEKKQIGVKYPEVDIIYIWDTIVTELIDDKLIPLEKRRIFPVLLAVEYEFLSNCVWPMPGVIDILDYLKIINLPIGIVSNAQFYTQFIFTALLKRSVTDLGFSPNLCVWSYQEGIAKPATDLFFKILEYSKKEIKDINAEEILYVGNDMLNDILAAKNAGLQTALFAGDKRSLRLRQENELCNNLNPDIIITDLLQIKDLFSSD